MTNGKNTISMEEKSPDTWIWNNVSRQTRETTSQTGGRPFISLCKSKSGREEGSQLAGDVIQRYDKTLRERGETRDAVDDASCLSTRPYQWAMSESIRNLFGRFNLLQANGRIMFCPSFLLDVWSVQVVTTLSLDLNTEDSSSNVTTSRNDLFDTSVKL